MNKIVINLLMLVLPVTSFCQKTTDSIPDAKTDYLQKSKNQKSAAWVLLGGGTALIATGFLVGNSENSTFDDAATGAILGGVGVLSALGSIPLFIASGRNKRKALQASTSIKMERAMTLKKQSFAQSSYPALTFKINL